MTLNPKDAIDNSVKIIKGILILLLFWNLLYQWFSSNDSLVFFVHLSSSQGG